MPKHVAAAAAHCAPYFFIPATQKGASSALFQYLSPSHGAVRPLLVGGSTATPYNVAHCHLYCRYLAKHPQVVRPLRGSHYKETGAYLQQIYSPPGALGARVFRFPHLEARVCSSRDERGA